MRDNAVDHKQEIRPTARKNLLILLVFFSVTFVNVKLFGDGDILRGLMVIALSPLAILAIMKHQSDCT